MAEVVYGDRLSVAAINRFAPDDRSITAAREVLKKGGFGTVEATADGRGWWVVCQGITDTYQVSVRWNAADGRFDCECTCPSPKYPCKHALALLLYLSDRPELRVEKEETRRAPGDFEPLIRAVFANLDDDTPRLIFADFLEENGQTDRAALIRLQCEMAHGKPTRNQKAEAERLVERLREQYVDPLPANFGADFERGFLKVYAHADYNLEDVYALPARFIELFRGGWVSSLVLGPYGYLSPAHFPLYRLVGELDTSRTQLREEGLLVLAAEAPVGAEDSRLSRVKVHKSDEAVYRAFTSGGAERLPRTPRMSGPQGPERRYAGITAAQLGLLIRAGRLDGVETLHLDGSIGDAGAELLANTDDLRRMHALTLARSGLTAEGARVLTALGPFPSLRELTLIAALDGPEAFAAMVQGSGMSQLTALNLYGEHVGDAGIRALADAKHVSYLETLRLLDTGASRPSIAEILASDRFLTLSELHYQGNAVTHTDGLRLALDARDRHNLVVAMWGVTFERTTADASIRLRIESDSMRSFDSLTAIICDSSTSRRITSLTMRTAGLTAKGLPDLAAGLSPAKLKALDLTNNKLGNDGAAALATAFAEFRPETLILSRNVIRKSGAVALANSPLLSSVKVLDLTHNNIGWNGISAIADSPHLKAIKELRLQGTNLTLNEWKAIEDKLGKKVVV